MTARQNFARGRINIVAIEEAQEAPDVVLGTFLVNSNTTIIQFDSGASYSFISATMQSIIYRYLSLSVLW
jgi:hypothetical protein